MRGYITVLLMLGISLVTYGQVKSKSNTLNYKLDSLAYELLVKQQGSKWYSENKLDIVISLYFTDSINWTSFVYDVKDLGNITEAELELFASTFIDYCKSSTILNSEIESRKNTYLGGHGGPGFSLHIKSLNKKQIRQISRDR